MTSLLAELMKEQSTLTAVEKFSAWHKEGISEAGPNEVYRALLPSSQPTSGQQYAFEVDLDACSGCKSCVIACHNRNGLAEDETWRKVGLVTGNSSKLPILQHVTTACHHCVDPGCMKGCPVQAYEKDPVTGIVRHLDDQCFGCQYCIMMCPYEVPQYQPELGIVRKCDMCRQRLEVGEAPACVAACPNRAIRIVLTSNQSTIKTLAVDVSLPFKGALENDGTTMGPQGLVDTAPLDSHTSPTTRYRTKHNAYRDEMILASFENSFAPSSNHVSHYYPLVAMLLLTQASVGTWIFVAVSRLLSADGSSLFAWLPIVGTVTGVVGVHLALLHLGRPTMAYKAFLGWRTSWLSREAIAFGVFMPVSALAVYLSSLPSGAVLLETPLLATTASCIVVLIGIMSVFCSAMIYIATKRCVWNGVRTQLEFGSSVIGLGFAFGSLFASSQVQLLASSVAVGTSIVGLLAYSLYIKLTDSMRRDRLNGGSTSPVQIRSDAVEKAYLDSLLGNQFRVAQRFLYGGIIGATLLLGVACTFPLSQSPAWDRIVLAAQPPVELVEPSASAQAESATSLAHQERLESDHPGFAQVSTCIAILFCLTVAHSASRVIFFANVPHPKMPGSYL